MRAHTSKGELDLRAALEIVGKWATQQERDRDGWRVIKSLLFIVGSENWNAAADLADALGVHPDDLEALYFQVERDKEKTK